MFFLNFIFQLITIFIVIINAKKLNRNDEGVIHNITTFESIDQRQTANGKIYTVHRKEVGEKDTAKIYGTRNDHNQLWETLKNEFANGLPDNEKPEQFYRTLKPPTRQNQPRNRQNPNNRWSNQGKDDTIWQTQSSRRNEEPVGERRRYQGEQRDVTQRNQFRQNSGRRNQESDIEASENQAPRRDEPQQNQSRKSNGQRNQESAGGTRQTQAPIRVEPQENQFRQNSGQRNQESVVETRQNQAPQRDEPEQIQSPQYNGQRNLEPAQRKHTIAPAEEQNDQQLYTIYLRPRLSFPQMYPFRWYK